jgi:hypothetical protein
MNASVITSIVRHLLGIASGYLIAKGIELDSGTIETVAGSIGSPPFRRGTVHVLGQDGRWRAGGALSGAWDFSQGTSNGILSTFDLDEGSSTTTYASSVVDLDDGTSV